MFVCMYILYIILYNHSIYIHMYKTTVHRWCCGMYVCMCAEVCCGMKARYPPPRHNLPLLQQQLLPTVPWLPFTLTSTLAAFVGHNVVAALAAATDANALLPISRIHTYTRTYIVPNILKSLRSG